MAENLNLIIVDDDPIVCSSLKAIVELTTRQDPEGEMQVIALGHDGGEAVRLYRKLRPDLIVLDIRMEPVGGIEACQEIMTLDPEAKVLFLTTFPDEEYIVEALRLGAKGYLMKSSAESIVPALRAIAQGQRVFGNEIVAKMVVGKNQQPDSQDLEEAKAHSIFRELTPTEWELVRLVAEAKNNKEIAAALHFSEGTVRNYLSTILTKLDMRDRTQLAVSYYKEGFA